MVVSAPDIPWYFRPVPFYAAFLAANIIGAQAYLSAATIGGASILAAVVAFMSLLFLSWPYLLYEYLAPFARSGSRHRPGRYNALYALLIFCQGSGFALAALGYGRNGVKDFTGWLIAPALLSFLVIMWSAAHLLTELESYEASGKHPPLLLTFLALFYSAFGIGWIAVRLRRLKRAGRILKSHSRSKRPSPARHGAVPC